MLDKQKKIIELRTIVQAVIACDADWETKYDVIFEAYRDSHRDSGVSIEWSDPDTSYEEDVRAFADALEEVAVQASMIVDSVEEAFVRYCNGK